MAKIGDGDIEITLAALQKNLPKIRIPTQSDRIFKDECVYCFDTPESEGGLFVCLNTFLGFGRQHVEKHFAKTENAVFLHIKRTRKLVAQNTTDTDGNQQPKRLAIGLEGGFDTGAPKYETEEQTRIVILPDFLSVALPCHLLPLKVEQCIIAVQKYNSARTAEDLKPWDGEQRFVTKHAETLVQIPNPPPVPPSNWKCENCDKTENLWMNLSDGRIFCGRKNFDGSGGNNHAIEHYHKTKYPLSVKLGTITPTGGDVYSYDEDDMVTDPNLAVHLAHFGINIQTMEKTEKTMAEMELDLNQKYNEWSVLQESDSKLQPLFGPGFTGMINLGNSCYMNSVLQVLFHLQHFKSKYFLGAEEIFSKRSNVLPPDDLTMQMAKLAVGVWSGSYSKPPVEGSEQADLTNGIRPHMFKSLVGKDHPEFSTKRQQDAEDFFRYLMMTLERFDRHGKPVHKSFTFKVEDRIQCKESGKVRYSMKDECVWSVPIPLEMATNKQELAAYEERKAAVEAAGQKWDGEIVRARLSFLSCTEAFAAPEEVSGFHSSALGKTTTAIKSARFGTFPDYLFVQLRKFTVGSDWTPKKLDVSVDMPDQLDIGYLRGYGKKPDEELLPEDTNGTAPVVQIDNGMVQQLMEMGFSREACQRAVYNTGSTGAENAMNWIMEHMGDPDLDAPFVPPGSGGKSAQITVSEDNIENISAMGFSRAQAIRALQNTDNNLERAVDWLFSHPDEVEPSNNNGAPAEGSGESQDGPGVYRLKGFISHMGPNTSSGHYVCHILVDDRWVIFNDEKVAQSEKPPKDLGYLYLYERVNQ